MAANGRESLIKASLLASHWMSENGCVTHCFSSFEFEVDPEVRPRSGDNKR